MHDVDRPSRRPTAEESRPGPFQDFNALDTIERVRDAAEKVSIGVAIAVDLGIQAADQEVIVIALRVLAAYVDAARVVQAFAQHGRALLRKHRARNDLRVGRQVLQFCAGLAGRAYLLRVVDGVVAAKRTVA